MTLAINAGDLRHRITLQRPAAGPDALGQMVPTWQTVDEVWGWVRQQQGREWLAADSAQASGKASVRIRWRNDVRPDWRVLWRGQPYAIVGEPVDVQGARVMLELLCVSGAAGGEAP